MAKLDLKKQMKNLYSPSTKEVQVVTVPKMNFIMIEGQGDPSGTAYQNAVQTIYSIAYTLKFMVKKEAGVDFAVMPLEGLWWADDLTDFVHAKETTGAGPRC